MPGPDGLSNVLAITHQGFETPACRCRQAAERVFGGDALNRFRVLMPVRLHVAAAMHCLKAKRLRRVQALIVPKGRCMRWASSMWVKPSMYASKTA